MLSKKLTFSLACLTMFIAIGLVGVLPTHAHDGDDAAHAFSKSFNVTFSIRDAFSDPGIQVPELPAETYTDAIFTTPTAITYDGGAYYISNPYGNDGLGTPSIPGLPQLRIPIEITFPKIVRFEKDVNTFAGASPDIPIDAEVLIPADFNVSVYDADGILRPTPPTLEFYASRTPLTDIVNRLPADSEIITASFQLRLTTEGVAPVPGDPLADPPVPYTGVVPNTMQVGDTVVVELPAGAVASAVPSELVQDGLTDHSIGTNARAVLSFTITLTDQRVDQAAGRTVPALGADDAFGTPSVVGIRHVRTLAEEEGFNATPGVSAPFDIVVTLSEEPEAFTKDHISVTNATITAFTKGDAITGSDGVDVDSDGVIEVGESADTNATGREFALRAYHLTISPNFTSSADVVIAVKDFRDKSINPEKWYRQDPADALVVTVDPSAVHSSANPLNATNNLIGANPQVKELTSKTVIPANGYLVLAYGENEGGSGVVEVSHKPADKKTEAQKLYNVLYNFDLPFPGNNLSNFFRNGGTLQLLYKDIAGNPTGADGNRGYGGASTRAIAAGDVIINEIMWGLDRDSTDSQYIELHNTTGTAIGIDENEWLISVGMAPASVLNTYMVVDTIGNSPYWEAPGSDGAVEVTANDFGFEVSDLVSMSRVGDNGTMADSWVASTLPSVNINGQRIGSPGAANTPSAPAPPPPTVIPVAKAADIRITEIMVDSRGDSFPQWIEIANVSGETVNLNGWTANIANIGADSLNVDLDGVVIAKNQVALIVSSDSRQGERQLQDDRIVNANGTLLSETRFVISLVPPTGKGDTAGNLEEGWELMSSTSIWRSSLVRTGDSGTAAESWTLATLLPRAYVDTYYGHHTDIGTPGWHGSGGALPVELSLFIAKRDPLTGAVEIRWETQSETNNAGFYIKRSESQHGTFEAINPVMIAGAGTTSEKQSYTYADATAKPNVVYYYQIEDVSLDGDRQTLTVSHRLKGHLSASGKATVIWGDLKSRE